MPPGPPTVRTVRVASVPGAHPYVRNLLAPGADAVRVLPDPPARDGARDRWWPPGMLTREWIEHNASAFDVMHLHFGLESSTTAELSDALDALAAVGKPVVFTVHDLENPQLADQRHHGEQLDRLIPRADAVTTLTAGAGREIQRRWGRAATLIHHPHVASLDDPAESGQADVACTLAVHLRDLRPNIDGVGTVRALAAALRLVRHPTPVSVVVDVNERVRDDGQLHLVADLVDRTPAMTLRRHTRYTDAELTASVASADAAVLPYSFGTHSGWVELCWDLGIPVITPPVGHMAEQHPDDAFLFVPESAADLALAIERALASGTRPGSAERGELVARRRRERSLQSIIIAGQHERLYRDLLR